MWGLIAKIVIGGLIAGAAAGAVIGIAGVIYDSICDRITRESVREYMGKKIHDSLVAGDYNNVNVGLLEEVTVIDVSQDGREAYVAFEVAGERYGLRSLDGTSLSECERFSLRV